MTEDTYIRFSSKDAFNTRIEMYIPSSSTVDEALDAFRHFLYALGYNPEQVNEETGLTEEG